MILTATLTSEHVRAGGLGVFESSVCFVPLRQLEIIEHSWVVQHKVKFIRILFCDFVAKFVYCWYYKFCLLFAYRDILNKGTYHSVLGHIPVVAWTLFLLRARAHDYGQHRIWAKSPQPSLLSSLSHAVYFSHAVYWIFITQIEYKNWGLIEAMHGMFLVAFD